MSLLEVRNLRIEYPSRRGVMAAVKDLSFTIEKGEILGVVGESGAGKSTIGNAIIDLLSPPGRIARGDVYLNGKKISGLAPEEMRKVRGAHIGFIFQDPMTSLNPLFTVERQLVETIEANTELRGAAGRGASHRADGLGWYSSAGNSYQAVSPPVLRWYAPTGGYCHCLVRGS